MRKYILFIAAAMSAILLLASCGQSAVDETRRPSDPSGSAISQEPAPTTEPDPTTSTIPDPVTIETRSYLDSGYPDGYEELTESQKMLYDVLDEALRDIIDNGWDPDKVYPLEYSITYLEGIEAENLFYVQHSAMTDLMGRFSFGDWTGDSFTWIGTDQDERINNYRDWYWECENAAEEILSGLTCDGTEYGIARAIAEWLAENVSYAYGHEERTEDWWLFSANGALTRGEAICMGYAHAYEFLCRKAGIDVLYVDGFAREPHSWNMIRIGEKWYHVDTTWMATTDMDKYQYFMIPDEMCRSLEHFDWTVANWGEPRTVQPPIADSPDLYEYYFETAEQALEYFEATNIEKYISYWLMFGSPEEQQKFYQLADTVVANRQGNYYMMLSEWEDDQLYATFFDGEEMTTGKAEP